ncbi:MAG TPA: histidine phosphatase family protein [Dehalococcoidia bacterium]|nr:histidine phosphatase family protein [Dehalococcoidia bacterium]
MRLIVVRHGETAHNRDRVTLGRADVPLNDLGVKQAAAVAASFASAPVAVYASPLRRAVDTASGIAAAHALGVMVEPALIEMDVGELEHLGYADLREKYPEFLRAWMSADAADARMPGGETLREVQERAWGAVARMREAHGDGDVVAVTHNFVALTIICAALGLPLSRFRRVRQALAAKTVIEFGERGTVLAQLNDVSHLAAAGLG